jgi:hypothetical protein
MAVSAGSKEPGTGVRMMLRRLARGGFALASAALPACYHYVPIQAAPEPGVQVEVELNDAGRVGMVGAVGAEIGSIQGVLESRSDTGLVVRVAQVLGEFGGVTRWEGEAVAIRPGYVRSLRERRFSATRTAVLAAAAGAGFVVFVVSRNLLGFGGAPSSTNTDGNGNSQ